MDQANFGLPELTWYLFKTIQIIVGLLIVCLGYRLFVLGVTGKASLVVDTSKVKGQLINAAPGLFFAVGGIVIIIWAIWVGQ